MRGLWTRPGVARVRKAIRGWFALRAMKRVDIVDLWVIESFSELGNWKKTRKLVEDFYRDDLVYDGL